MKNDVSGIVEANADVAFDEKRLNEARRLADEGLYRPLVWRLAQLDGLLRFIDEHEAEILAALKADLGRCAADARMADITMVKSEIKLIGRNLQKWMRPRRVHTPLAAQPGRSWIEHEAYGLVLILGAWNYPFQEILIPLAGALAAGNAAVVKPSEGAPHAVAVMVAHLEKYLDSTATIVIAGGPETAARLLERRFDKIFFTGSSRIGRLVMKAAAANLTPVTLELGGKNPVLISEDAPLEVTARRVAWGRFMNAGQICVAPDYVLVPEAMRLPLITEIERAITRFYGSDPQQSPSYGRIIHRAHFDRLSAFLKSGTIAVGGKTDQANLYIAPTVLTDLPADSAVLQEEIFGPILPVIGYRDIDEALRLIRQRPKPLAFYLFTKDRQLQKRILRETSSGSVVINDVLVNQMVPGLPFGGVGESGMGSFHGRFTWESFSHAKAVVRRGFWADLDLRYPPFNDWKDRLLQWLI